MMDILIEFFFPQISIKSEVGGGGVQPAPYLEPQSNDPPHSMSVPAPDEGTPGREEVRGGAYT